DAQQATEYGLQAIAAAEALGDVINLAKAYSFTGVAYRNRGLYPEALDYYTRGLEQALKTNDREQQCYGYLNLANLHLYLSGLDVSQQYLETLRPIAENLGNPGILAYYHLNYGRIQLGLENLEEARKHVQRALAIRRRLEDQEGQSVCMKYLGDIYLAQKYFRQAQLSYEESLLLNDIESDVDLYASNLNGLAKAYIHQDAWTVGKEYAQKSFRTAKEAGFVLRAKEASATLAEIAHHVGDYQAADSIRKIVVAYQQQLALEDFKHLSHRYNYQLQAAEVQYQQAEEARQYQSWLILGITGVGAVILAIVFITWQLIYRRRAAYQNEMLAMVRAQKVELEERVMVRSKELIDKNAKLRQLSRYKEELTHMIAHDLKNPLNIILGLSEDPKWGRKSESMKEAGQTMLQMVGNMLDVQKFEEAQMELEWVHLRLHDLVGQATGQVFHALQAKSLMLQNQVPQDCMVQGDEGLILRVFMNLFTNAIKHSSLGDLITVEASISEDDRITVSVIDQGQGMDASQIAKVFDKYYQGTGEVSVKGRSTGLGLTFCRLAVEAHGGAIQVTSSPNQGARFTFDLPQGQVEAVLPRTSEMAPSAVLSAELPSLHATDWQHLGDLPERLRQTPLYEARVIRRLLKEIPDEPPYLSWKAAVLQAASHWDQNRYVQLLTPDSP
ncbi:MAG TPA: hypothetical protein DCP28_19190, partial [Cytophagales bacterium]|nr:hypothetical protein [Cytophagales bacterium]